jgi:hypothetical protein
MKYLLAVGVLLLASVAPLCAEPANVPSVNSFARSCGVAPASRNGFLLPTLATVVPDARPRLIVTEHAIRRTARVRLSSAAEQDQPPAQQQRSWFGRNWKWFVPVAVGVAFGVACAVGCFPAGG